MGSEATRRKTGYVDKIGAVSTFLRELEKRYKQFEFDKGMNTVFFRGHSRADTYKLEPSIFRDHSWIKNEHVMFRQIIADVPEEFHELETTFDKLVKMQHYSFPTRLLDITKNALAALYFACKSNSDVKEDGEVIMFNIPKSNIMFSDSDEVSIISNLAKIDMNKNINSYDIYEDKSTHANQLLESIEFEKPFFKRNISEEDYARIVCVYPKQNNKRIIRQSGAFLLFGNNNYKNGLETKEIENWVVSPKLIINSDKKESIIEQLEYLGISESSLFPEIDSVANNIKERYKSHK